LTNHSQREKNYDWSTFIAYDLRSLYYKPILSRIVCDINHPGLLEPLRKIRARMAL